METTTTNPGTRPGALTLPDDLQWNALLRHYEEIRAENKYLRREMARVREQIDALMKTIRTD